MIRNLVEKYTTLAIELNDYMADNPRIGGEEFKAAKKLQIYYVIMDLK